MAHLQGHGTDPHSMMNSGQIQDGTLYANPYNGYHQNQADQQHMMHVQQNEISQVADWTSNYQVMSGQNSGAEMLGSMDDSSKLVYDVHHVHHQIMPHQQQCDMNDQWYGHQNQSIQQSDPMIDNSYMQNTQGQMMMMNSYHHQNAGMQQAEHSQQPHLIQHSQEMMQQVMMSNTQQNLSMSMGHQISHQETVQSLNVGNATYHRKSDIRKRSSKKVIGSRHGKKAKQEEDWNVHGDIASDEDLFSTDEDDDSDDMDSENEDKNNRRYKQSRAKASKVTKKQTEKKPSNKQKTETLSNISPLDENAKEVALKFKGGCECVDQNCFDGVDPVLVSRHRLNIAELSKLEHDMYLMGVAMACLDNSEETNRQTERQRARIKYRFMGREVCQSAFLYLHNTTLHQLKSIRKHVQTSGVSARIHGNHRKKPHNTFSLDTYQDATRFMNAYLGSKDNTKRKGNKQSLSAPLNCKQIHSEYLAFASLNMPDSKPLGYSTFRQFIRVQFQNQLPTFKSSISKG